MGEATAFWRAFTHGLPPIAPTDHKCLAQLAGQFRGTRCEDEQRTIAAEYAAAVERGPDYREFGRLFAIGLGLDDIGIAFGLAALAVGFQNRSSFHRVEEVICGALVGDVILWSVR